MIDMKGKKFGLLNVKYESYTKIQPSGQRVRMWMCKCDCGASVVVNQSALRSGNSKSCGCKRKESLKNSNKLYKKTHGMTNTSIFKIWTGILSRCKNKNDNAYSSYGGRGISVCKRWEKFKNFYEDIGDRPSKNHSVDRIDNDGDYCPENCRWATSKEQARNRRNNRLIKHNGKEKCVSEWAEITGISYSSLIKRLNANLEINEVFREFAHD